MTVINLFGEVMPENVEVEKNHTKELLEKLLNEVDNIDTLIIVMVDKEEELSISATKMTIAQINYLLDMAKLTVLSTS